MTVSADGWRRAEKSSDATRSLTLDQVLAHPDLVQLARALRLVPGREIRAEPPMRWAAIALVLRLGALAEPELLMIRRAEAENDPWSGHIACPGGRAEAEDPDLAHTATRETLEETGIDLARVGRILGTLDDISPRTPVLPGIVVRPFVAAVPSTVEIVQSQEVAAAFWVPLSALRRQTSWGRGMVTVRGVPREVSTFLHGDYMVWGLTERVLRQLLERMNG